MFKMRKPTITEIILGSFLLALLVVAYLYKTATDEVISSCKTEVYSLQNQLSELKRNNDSVVDTIRRQLFEKEKTIEALAVMANKLKPKYENIKNTKFTKSDTALLESLYRTIQHPIER